MVIVYIYILIGTYSTTIYPIYEGLVLRNAMKMMEVGGEHITGE